MKNSANLKKANLNIHERIIRISFSAYFLYIAIYPAIIDYSLLPIYVSLAVLWLISGIVAYDPIKAFFFEPPEFHLPYLYEKRINALTY